MTFSLTSGALHVPFREFLEDVLSHMLSVCTSARLSLIESRTFCRAPTMAMTKLVLCVGLLALPGPFALAEHENDMQNLVRPSFETNDLPPTRLLIVLSQ